jgi:hypothetical protein
MDAKSAGRDTVACCPALLIRCLIQTLLKVHDGVDDVPECGSLSEYHPGHRLIILLEIGEHFIVRRKGVASRSGGREVEVGPVEEHPGMSNAVSSHAAVVYEAFPGFRCEEPVDIIIMTGNPLTSAA